MIDHNIFIETLNEKGWVKIGGVYDQDFVRTAKEKVDALASTYEQLQKKGGVWPDSKNAFHHVCVFHPELVEGVFNDDVWGLLETFFKGKFILNSFGVTRVEPDGHPYTQNMHRDARDIHSSKDMLNLIVLLDKSTKENGATRMLEGSHKDEYRPTDEEFKENYLDIEGEAGDLIIFNPYAWHASGENTSDHTRTIITPMVTRPFIKSGLDYSRALGHDYIQSCDEKMRQLFGYKARVAASLEEFYVPKEHRTFQSDQV
jgi:hypothetical protein